MDNEFNKISGELEQTPPSTVKRRFTFQHWFIGILLAFVVVGGAFRIGYMSGEKGLTFSPKNFKVINREDAPVDVDYNLLWQALKIVQDKYIDSENIDPQKVLYGAIQGAISAAGDEYTQFFDPKTLAEFKSDLQGSFSGIGAEIVQKDGSIMVVAPLEGSPAERAGILAKDYIVKINGESTDAMGSDVAASKIRGPEGSQVIVTIYREGKPDTFDLTITREKIEVKSVKLEYKDVNGKKVAIIKISKFGDDTVELFNLAADDIVKNNPVAVIVDQRNNPGGYLDSSVEVASQWLESGKLVVSEDHSEKDIVTYNSLGYNKLGKFKTIVLINGGSASAAEILAGALKDNGKAILLGETSFGKGSVQELVPLGKDSAVKVTIAKWITPGGKNLNKEGLEPDIKVLLTTEDAEAKRDPQMDKALEEAVK
jgi:carboxyl-terminal processing protease